MSASTKGLIISVIAVLFAFGIYFLFLAKRNYYLVDNPTNDTFYFKINNETEISNKSENPAKCIDRRMERWEEQRDKELNKWCADLAKKGQECRISSGQEEIVRQEALEKITPQCP